VALLPLLLVLALVAAVAVGAAVVRRSPPSVETTVAAARQHARLTWTAAGVLGAAAAIAVGTGRLGDPVPARTASRPCWSRSPSAWCTPPSWRWGN
jgi:hypothetical protein